MNEYQQALMRIIELEDKNAELKRERDQFKAGHIRYRKLYRAECDKLDALIIKAFGEGE